MNYKLSPENFRKILNGIDLNDIVLTDISATINHSLMPGKVTVAIDDNASYKNIENGFSVENSYTLTIKNHRKVALKIEATYLIMYSSKIEISDDFFDIYKEFSLPLNIWPYFRELVNTITSKMNIKPLTLPLLKR
jgi:preprotein translocase subunit SecB